MSFLTLMLFLFFTVGGSPVCSAQYRPISEESISANFKIFRKEVPEVVCRSEGYGVSLQKPLKFKQKGCILRLEIVSFPDGKPPYRGFNMVGLYSIYEDGSLCEKKLGNIISGTVETMRKECGPITDMDSSDSLFYCKAKPEPKLTTEVTNQVLRCTSRGVQWKFTAK